MSQPPLSQTSAASLLPDSPPAKHTFSFGMPPAAGATTPAFQSGTAETTSSSPQQAFPGFNFPQQRQATPEPFDFQAGATGKVEYMLHAATSVNRLLVTHTSNR